MNTLREPFKTILDLVLFRDNMFRKKTKQLVIFHLFDRFGVCLNNTAVLSRLVVICENVCGRHDFLGYYCSWPADRMVVSYKILKLVDRHAGRRIGGSVPYIDVWADSVCEGA